MVRHAEAPDGADRFGEGADDEIDLAFQPLVFIHAAAVGAEKAHRMGLVDQHHAAVLLRDSDHFPERRDIAEHRIDARSEEHTSELQSLMRISYAVFCLKNKISNPYITMS